MLLVHGMAADARTLRSGLADAPARGAASIAYDRRGYGASGAPEPYGGDDGRGAGRGRRGAARRLDAAPAVVAGDGFGALVALDLLRRHRDLVRAAPCSSTRRCSRSCPRRREGSRGERGRARGGASATGGPGGRRRGLARRPAPTPRRSPARGAAHRAFFADYAGLATWPVTRRELRALDAPAVVVTGPGTPAPVLAAADRLAALLPRPGARDGDLAGAVRSLL